MQGEHAIMSQEKSLIIHGQDFHLQQIGIQESLHSFHIETYSKTFYIIRLQHYKLEFYIRRTIIFIKDCEIFTSKSIYQ